MTGLARQLAELPAEERRSALLRLCEPALERWREHCREHAPMRYIEGVCGTRQEVDTTLPADALEAARRGADHADVGARYAEPLAALQDDDLRFPETVTYAYYAIYNLFRLLAQGREVDPWLIANQALSTDPDPTSWERRLRAALASAGVDRCR